MLTIERLLVTVALDDPAEALRRAREAADAGDESWAQWINDYDRGEALVVRLDVTVEADDGQRRTIEVANRGVFIEADAHAPKVERQVSDIVSKDFEVLTRELSKLDRRFDEWDLDEMYFHVELGRDVVATLRRSGSRARGSEDPAPEADARLSRPAGPVRRR
jgi:hypothetical protein